MCVCIPAGKAAPDSILTGFVLLRERVNFQEFSEKVFRCETWKLQEPESELFNFSKNAFHTPLIPNIKKLTASISLTCIFCDIHPTKFWNSPNFSRPWKKGLKFQQISWNSRGRTNSEHRIISSLQIALVTTAFTVLFLRCLWLPSHLQLVTMFI